MDKILKSVDKFDENMRPNERSEGEVAWHSPLDEPFQINGFAWFAEEAIFRRLPTWATYKVPEAVDHLANHTAGGQIRFQSDSASLSVKVKLKGRADMPHMPATGQCGVDCYVGDQDTAIPLQYANSTKYDINLIEYECSLFTNWQPTMRNIVLNMPLYQGVEEISIGLDKGATISPPPKYLSDKKIIIYGTSITQGGCATRPGMMYSNILSRKIPLEFINLGFSGNGKGEPELSEIISQIDNPGCLIVDYEGNCVSTELFRKTLPEFIKIYRDQHPLTPIIVVSRIPYAREKLTPHLYEMRMERKHFQQSLVNELREKGDLNIYFFDGSRSLGDEDFFECTVDGSHPTDLGFLRMANALEPVLRTILL
ncbi:SGNH/GDSL hydrolase family protein [Bacillus niameyensis]|uniref:SGNH/GDSL hydrolase family protein n=1 Tax=Bacillus niameyensis TaxID=1522308 RepID=UPI00078275AE|nr:SGNH/GDSL hydrolase family protein [Bacillus niameyensis]